MNDWVKIVFVKVNKFLDKKCTTGDENNSTLLLRTEGVQA